MWECYNTGYYKVASDVLSPLLANTFAFNLVHRISDIVRFTSISVSTSVRRFELGPQTCWICGNPKYLYNGCGLRNLPKTTLFGMPDMPAWSKHPRHRRGAGAPQVDFSLWVKLITRRVEQHLKRDWLLGFTMSNVLFRTQLNQCRTVYSYDRIRRADGSLGFTAAELESGAISICQALDGQYRELNGKLKKVNGDFTKVRFAVKLNEAGRRLLQNLEHTSRQLKGTMEVRKLMRFETNAGRVRRGVSIFTTFSPDETHNTLMLRLHRSRMKDPIHVLDPEHKRFGGRLEPSLDYDYVEMQITVKELCQWLPSYDNRRCLMSRDSLASVEGFRLSILVTVEYLWGMRVCANCPDCNHTEEEDSYYACCQDLFGNNAYSDGGACGRGDGIC